MEARWERSPRKRNMFIVGGAYGEWKTGDCRYSSPAPDVQWVTRGGHHGVCGQRRVWHAWLLTAAIILIIAAAAASFSPPAPIM